MPPPPPISSHCVTLDAKNTDHIVGTPTLQDAEALRSSTERAERRWIPSDILHTTCFLGLVMFAIAAPLFADTSGWSEETPWWCGSSVCQKYTSPNHSTQTFYQQCSLTGWHSLADLTVSCEKDS